MKERLPETLNTPGDLPSQSDPTQPAIGRLLADQEARWQKGERVLVETFIEQQPSLRDDARAVMGLIANEIVLRRKHGEAAPAVEYRQRFPHFAAELDDHFAQQRTRVDSDLPKTLHMDKQSPDSVARALAGSPALPGTVAGYEIREVLGRGGMGVVYKAWQKGLNRCVALKMILAGMHAGMEDVTRFRIEAEAAARLQHPNITQIYEVGESQGRPYFAMEYVEGCSLADKLDGTPQPPHVAAELVEILARAMHHAHERGIVHRDLKPANILLMNATGQAGHTTSLGQPKISDFGLAKRLDADMRQTQTGAVLGTPSYMSPEQASGKIGDIGPATDVYAMGAILYDMLTGRPPFKSNTLADTLHQVQAMEPVSPTRLEPNVPRDLETICLKCLRKEPARRYASSQALAIDLRRFLNGEPIEARPTPAWERVLKWARRRPATAALIVVSMLSAFGLLVGGTWSYAQIRDSLTREEKQRQQADASFRDALGAVNQMLLQVGAVDLADVPQMEPVRKKLLAEALSFMHKFLAERGADPSVRHEAGRAYLYQGDVLDMLGNAASAEQAYHSAIAQLTALSEDGPRDKQAQRDLARAYNSLGVLLKKANRFQDAEAALRRALSMREQLAKDSPDEADYKRDIGDSLYFLGADLAVLPGKQKEAEQAYQQALASRDNLTPSTPEDERARARTLTNLGNLLRVTDQQKAENAYRQADRIQQELADKYPNVPAYRRELARSHHNLAVVLWLSGKYATAEGLFGQALKLLDDLTNHFPEVPEYKREAAGIHRSRGDLLAMREQYARAEAEFRLAESIVAKLVEASPLMPDYRRIQANLCPSLARVLENTHRPLEARKVFDQALSIQEMLVKEFPDVTDYHGDLAITRYNLADILYKRKTVADTREAARYAREAVVEHCLAWKVNPQNVKYRNELILDYKLLLAALLGLHQHAEAARVAAELPQTFPDDGREFIVAAASLGRCAMEAMVDQHLSEGQRQDLAAEYGDKAVAYIREGVQKGFKDANQLKESDNLRLLRERDDFKRILQELQRSTATGA